MSKTLSRTPHNANQDNKHQQVPSMYPHLHMAGIGSSKNRDTIPRHTVRSTPPINHTHPTTIIIGMATTLLWMPLVILGHSYGHLHLTLAITSKQVMIHITTATWKYILDTWQIQNQHLHQNVDQLDWPNYQQAVTMLYELSNQLPPAAQAALYRQPLATVLEQPTPQLQTWYQWGHKYFTQQLKVAIKQARLHTLGIQTFFHPKAQQEPDLHPP